MRTFLLWLAFLFPLLAWAGTTTPDPLPLATGTAWVYEANVKWEVAGKVQGKTLPWTTAITSIVSREQIVFALGSGLPSDLCSYEEGARPRPFLMVKVGPWKLFLIQNPERIAAIWKQALDPDDPLIEIVTEADLFLDFPLIEGKPFGESGQITRSDASYVYLVNGRKPFRAAERAGLEGAPNLGDTDEYTILFRTRPDHSAWKFVPGLGISGFTHSHHGTVSEVDCRLKEFRSGSY